MQARATMTTFPNCSFNSRKTIKEHTLNQHVKGRAKWCIRSQHSQWTTVRITNFRNPGTQWNGAHWLVQNRQITSRVFEISTNTWKVHRLTVLRYLAASYSSSLHKMLHVFAWGELTFQNSREGCKMQQLREWSIRWWWINNWHCRNAILQKFYCNVPQRLIRGSLHNRRKRIRELANKKIKNWASNTRKREKKKALKV